MMPLVRVLTPTFGRPDLLARAVRIFFSYRYPRKEMVIVDDSPTAADLPRSPLIRYVKLDDRMVLGSKHNLAASIAQGEILMHQDDDDLFSPMRVTKQVEPMLTKGVDVTGIRMRFLREESTGRFFQWAPRAKFVQTNPTTRPIFEFHDSNAAFHRRVWDSGLQYTAAAVAQKVHLLNDAVRAGFKAEPVENEGLFVYSRHDVNTWKFSGKLLAAVRPPSFVREPWFRSLLGDAA